MNGAAVPHDITVSDHELLERRVDVVEIDIGGEAIDAGIGAGRFLAMHITPRGDEIGKCPEIGEPTRHRTIGMVAADALVIRAFFPSLAATAMLSKKTGEDSIGPHRPAR